MNLAGIATEAATPRTRPEEEPERWFRFAKGCLRGTDVATAPEGEMQEQPDQVVC